LLDDIATLLDDISVMGKLAAKKPQACWDDLSLNAQQVSGVRANRELPVVWGVAKGSFLNKVILVPLALLISAFIPWAITPLLMIGGAFLCFEGVEKVLHSFSARKQSDTPEMRQQRLEALAAQDPKTFERDKVKGAIRTDFILSAEIVAITLGIVSDAPLLNQVLILSGIAILVTVGVYGLVGLIVKLDDIGYWLEEKSSAVARGIGKSLLVLAPVADEELVGGGHAGDVPRGRRDCGSRYCAAAPCHRTFLLGAGGRYRGDSAHAAESGAGLYHWRYRGCGGEAG
jgi:predicted DNA repair protein MutK